MELLLMAGSSCGYGAPAHGGLQLWVWSSRSGRAPVVGMELLLMAGSSCGYGAPAHGGLQLWIWSSCSWRAPVVGMELLTLILAPGNN